MAAEPGQIDETELAAVFARLRRDVGMLAGENGGTQLPPARREADALWAVTAERQYLARPGTLGRLRGLALTPAKAVLRRMMRWYVEPLAHDQRQFNAVVLRLADQLRDESLAATTRLDATVEQLEAAVQILQQAIQSSRAEIERGFELQLADVRRDVERPQREHDERLTRVERRLRSATPQVVQAAPPVQPTNAPTPVPDYFSFESTMRGSIEEVREKQAVYVPDFRAAGPVLDVGCGRGEFLVLLREAGVEARGVDVDADMVAYCQGEGLDVEQADAFVYLAALDDGALGGIFSAHVVEHLTPPQLVQFLDLVAAKLREGGVFVAETPNPTSLIALPTFFADLSHEQPVHPKTFDLLARQAGLRDVELRFMNEPPPQARLQPVELPEGPELEQARWALNTNVERLNDVVFAAQDYALVARA